MRPIRRKSRRAKLYLVILLVTFFSVGLVFRQLGLSENVGTTSCALLEEDIALEPCSHYMKEINIQKERLNVECERILETKSKSS